MGDHRRGSMNRRAVLAALASTPLAGCGGVLRDVTGRSRPTLDGTAIRAAVRGDAPTVPERVPVDIEDRYVAAGADRVRALLDPVPMPLGPRQIPNGAIRERLAAAHDRAKDQLTAAEDAASLYEAIRSIRHARSEAAELNAGWRAIDDGLTREGLLDEAEAINDDVAAFEASWSYLGADPVRATLVHRRIEFDVDRAAAESSVGPASLDREQESPVSVGDLGGDLERARALLDDVTYLFGRFTASLDDPVDLQEEIRAAADTLRETVLSRVDSLPAFADTDPSASFDRDIEDTPVAWALRELHDDASYTGWENRRGAPDHPARTVLVAETKLAELRAFAALHERVADGSPVGLDSASTVASHRSAAIAAIESARASPPHPGLVNHGLTDPAMWIRAADRDLADVDDDVPPGTIAWDVGFYLAAAAVARAVPAAVADVVAALVAD